MLACISCGGREMLSWRRVTLPNQYSDSHILSIDARGDKVLLGTYGRGALFGDSSLSRWTTFDTSSGLSWNFVLGGDWHGDFIILAMLGDGVNISSDGGVNWQRYGYNFFGTEYLYAVGAGIEGGKKYVPTADGLVVFDSIGDWRAITEKEGLASQYIYDMVIKGDTIALGTLHGFSLSGDGGRTWSNFSPNGGFTSAGLPASKVRGVEFAGKTLYAGCDDGLYSSPDNGSSWTRIGEGKLKSEFIHDLHLGPDGSLWIATYKEAANYVPETGKWHIFDEASSLPGGSINCIAMTESGNVLVGTNFGLFRLKEAKALETSKPEVDAIFAQAEEPIHQWMLRPIPPEEQNCKDQTYLYGSTMGGNFRQHQGNEYNNPEGVPILAVDNGVIVFTDTAIGHSVLECDTRQADLVIYAHYHHQHEILKHLGDRVSKGEQIGTVGKKGNVTNEHLHFEVALSPVGSQVDSISHTRNSELWVAPLPGCGTIVGTLVDMLGNPVGRARIYGVTKPIPTETPFSFAETYMDKVHPSEAYGENFAIGDVPAGDYVLRAKAGELGSRVRVHVESGKITRVKMQLK